MSFHFLVRFEAQPGKHAEFREELLRVINYTRTEPGCLSIRAFESLHDPAAFAIHSEWEDEPAFERHAVDPHTVQFVEAAQSLLTDPIQGLRSREIGPVSKPVAPAN